VDKGSPSIINVKTLGVQPLISAVYDAASAGGRLHIALDDWNLDDGSLSFCDKLMHSPPGDEETAEMISDQASCLVALQQMTEDERVSALAIFEGCVVVG
jgi:hypothetical protein